MIDKKEMTRKQLQALNKLVELETCGNHVVKSVETYGLDFGGDVQVLLVTGIDDGISFDACYMFFLNSSGALSNVWRV